MVCNGTGHAFAGGQRVCACGRECIPDSATAPVFDFILNVPGRVGSNVDPWIHRSSRMSCATCMWFVEKVAEFNDVPPVLGRCRRHAPTMSGYPVVYPTDWCGDHKLDETKVKP